MRMIPEKKYSGRMEGGISISLEKGLVFGLDLPSEEQERIWYYHSKLVFKDGKFLVRLLNLLIGTTLNEGSGYGAGGQEETTTVCWQAIPPTGPSF